MSLENTPSTVNSDITSGLSSLTHDIQHYGCSDYENAVAGKVFVAN